MSRITTIGQIPFYAGGQSVVSVNPPVILDFRTQILVDEQNDVTFYFSASDYKQITIYTSLIDDSGQQVGDQESFSVNGLTSYQVTKDLTYRKKVFLKASNDNGSVDSASLTIDKATPDLQVEDGQVIASCLIERSSQSFNQVNVNLTLTKSDKYSLDQIRSIILLNKREDFLSWSSIELAKNVAQEITENGIIVRYTFLFNGVQFLRPNIGGFFDFQVKISINGFTSVLSESKKIYYEDIDPSQVSTTSDADFPKAEIADKFTSLRYEINTKLYQIFVLQSNIRYEPQETDGSTRQPTTFSTKFLDTNDVAGLTTADYSIMAEDSTNYFYYEFNNSKSDASTKGYMYPASVSEIYPYILPEGDSSGNSSIVFFWKINKSFYDYSYLKNQVSVLTRSFKVKLQCKESGTYVDMMSTSISLLKDVHYQSSTDKFIIKITRDVDIIPSKRSLFNSILESDNASDKIRFVVVEHQVACSSTYGGYREYTFDKLLLPPEWTYIAYDKYIPKDAVTRKKDKIQLSASNSCLRGIRLPDQGFKAYDKIRGIRNFVPVSSGGSYVAIFDLNVAYKISCTFDSFYKDPIIEGTINSIVLPSIPDDVFLIPPLVTIPEPNLVPLSQGGRKADARVNLDDYGKIKSVEMIDPGGGYSLYSTQLEKRKQTFTDFVPAVITSYKVNSSPVSYAKNYLTPSNASFASNYLLASLRGGVRINSVDADAATMGDLLTEAQKQELKEYLSEDIKSEVEVPENSSSIYEERGQDSTLVQNVFDQEWYEVSRLYQEKYNNPMNNVSIFSEDEDPGSSQLSDSSTSPDISTSEADTTPTSVQAGSDQTDQDGQPWSFFTLNNLKIIPDGSAAVSVSTTRIAPPYLTLLPTTVRRDGERGYGPLPNMKTRAEMFNRIVAAINNLNEVRVEVPFVWLVTTSSKFESWATPTDAYSLTEITFNPGGTKILNSSSVDDSFQAINQGFGVSASRSVGKATKKSNEVSPFGLQQGVYAISTQDSSSAKFTPRIHPLMADAIPSYIGRGIRKRILGIVNNASYNCSTVASPISPYLGVPVAFCSFLDNTFERPFAASYPDTTFTTETNFQFFDAGGFISATPRGTARYVGVQIGVKNGYAIFCGQGCGDSDSKSIDFTYANIFPATFKF